MRTPLPNTNTGRLLFHGGGRQGFNILVAPVGSTSFTLTEDDIYSGGFLYNAASTSSQTIELGSVFASQLCLSVIDYDNTYTGINLAGARLTVTIKTSDGTTDYTVPFGQFTVDEVKRSANRIDLIALDDFIKFDKAYTDTDYPFTESTSLYDVIEWICSECGVTFGTLETDLTNADYMVKTAPKGTNITYRQLLSWAAQLTGSCAKFNASSNALEFVWYNAANSYDISTDDVFDHILSTEPITITGIQVNQGGSARLVRGSLTYPVTIDDNGFITYDSDFMTALIAISSKVVGTTYHPFTGTKVNDCLVEPFDKIVYTDSEGTEYVTYLTTVNYAFSDATGIVSIGESVTNKSYASGSPFTMEQQALIGNLQNRVKVIRYVNQPNYLMDTTLPSDNGLGGITNGYWYWSNSMDEVLEDSIVPNTYYNIELSSSEFSIKTRLRFDTTNKVFVLRIADGTIHDLSDFIGTDPSLMQIVGRTMAITPLYQPLINFMMKIDIENQVWAVTSTKNLEGATLKIYRNNNIPIEEYLPDDTIDVDTEPVEDSDNFATSGSLYEGLSNKQDTLFFDDEPTEDSNNPVYSDGIYRALQEKQNSLTFDNTPTADSENPVTSDGIYQSLQAKQDTLEFDTTPTSGSTKPVTSDGIKSALDGKQDTLTFDNIPTSGSSNPVKSSGIASALSDKMDNPASTTASGQIPVMRSSGVEWMFDSSFYGTFEVHADEDLNADKFWTDRARFYMSSESTTHILNRPNNTGGLCFVITLGGLGASWKYQVYMTRDNACDIYVRYRNGTATPQSWKHINMT